MIPTLFRTLLLAFLVAPAFGAAGDGTRSFTNLVFGPIVYLVAAVGILACLYQFARGNKAAAFFILGGLFFLGFARAVLRGWLDPAGSAGFTMNLGAFPIYGDNGTLTETSSKNFYGYIASWAYIGLSISHALSMAMLSLGIPLLIATIGALITYHRITVRHQAGSVIGYVISAILVVVFCIFPSASFVPPAESSAPPSDVMRAIAGLDSGVPLPSSTAPDALSIPLLPALVLTAGTDLTQAIGNVINPDPNSMYVAQMLRAARSSAMPDGWETEYEDFAVHCAAAYKGFVISEAETSDATVPFIKARLAEARLGRVSASSLNLISNWGDSVLSFVPLHAYVANDANDDRVYGILTSDPDVSTGEKQFKNVNQDIFWISPDTVGDSPGRQAAIANGARGSAGHSDGIAKQTRTVRSHRAAEGDYGPKGSPEHRHDDAHQFDASVAAFRAAEAAGDAPAASAAAHAIIAGHDNVVNGTLRPGAAATLGDVKKIGEAMEYLGKHGDQGGAEGARRIYREGQRMADGMLRDGHLTNPGERKDVIDMRERLRLGEAQARFSKADVMASQAQALEKRAAGATSRGERNTYSKRASEMRQEAQTERQQAGRQAGDALAGMSGTVADAFAEIKRSALDEGGANGPSLHRVTGAAKDLLSLADAASKLEKGSRPRQVDLRSPDGQGIGDRLEAIAEVSNPNSRNVLLGLTAAAEGRHQEAAHYFEELKKGGGVVHPTGESGSTLRPQ